MSNDYTISIWQTDSGLWCVDYNSASVGMTLYTSFDRQDATAERDRLVAMDPDQMHDYVMSR